MRKLLLVDDSPIFLKILERILSPKYSIVAKGTNGYEGLSLYKTHKPDLVLLDITMPNCNGKDCLKMIREFDPKAKVIMVSSLGDDSTVNECKAMGAKGFIKKDLVSARSSEDEEKLRAQVEQLLAG